MYKVYRLVFSPTLKVDEIATVSSNDDAIALINHLDDVNIDLEENVSYRFSKID